MARRSASSASTATAVIAVTAAVIVATVRASATIAATVVIATGCEDPNWAEHARAAGVRDVIEKPGTIAAMAKVLNRLLSGDET